MYTIIKRLPKKCSEMKKKIDPEHMWCYAGELCSAYGFSHIPSNKKLRVASWFHPYAAIFRLGNSVSRNRDMCLYNG